MIQNQRYFISSGQKESTVLISAPSDSSQLTWISKLNLGVGPSLGWPAGARVRSGNPKWSSSNSTTRSTLATASSRSSKSSIAWKTKHYFLLLLPYLTCQTTKKEKREITKLSGCPLVIPVSSYFPGFFGFFSFTPRRTELAFLYIADSVSAHIILA